MIFNQWFIFFLLFCSLRIHVVMKNDVMMHEFSFWGWNHPSLWLWEVFKEWKIENERILDYFLCFSTLTRNKSFLLCSIIVNFGPQS